MIIAILAIAYVRGGKDAKLSSGAKRAKGKSNRRAAQVVPPRVGFEDPEHRRLLEWLVEHGTTFADGIALRNGVLGRGVYSDVDRYKDDELYAVSDHTWFTEKSIAGMKAKFNEVLKDHSTLYGRSKSPLATENLLENTDGVPRPHQRSLSGRQPATFQLC